MKTLVQGAPRRVFSHRFMAHLVGLSAVMLFARALPAQDIAITNARVIVGNGTRQSIARQVMVLIGPSRCIGDLIGKGCSREDLRQQWVRIKGDSRYQPVQFLRRIRRGRRLPPGNYRTGRQH